MKKNYKRSLSYSKSYEGGVAPTEYMFPRVAGCVFFSLLLLLLPIWTFALLISTLFLDLIRFVIIIVVLFIFEIQSIPRNFEWLILLWILLLTKDKCLCVWEIWIANSLFDDCFPEAGMIKFSRSFF
jgi:hypothetical protein